MSLCLFVPFLSVTGMDFSKAVSTKLLSKEKVETLPNLSKRNGFRRQSTLSYSFQNNSLLEKDLLVFDNNLQKIK